MKVLCMRFVRQSCVLERCSARRKHTMATAAGAAEFVAGLLSIALPVVQIRCKQVGSMANWEVRTLSLVDYDVQSRRN